MAKQITKQNFEQEVVNAGSPILLDFWATWCGPCQRQGPIIDQMAADGLNVGKVNVDEQPELAERFGVEVIPTFYLFQNGAHGDKLIAPGSQAQLEDWIAAQRG